MTFFRYLFTKAFLKQLLFAVLALVVLSFLILWWLRSTTNHSQKIEVPNLATMSLDKVEEQLEELDLRYEILDSANYNPDYPKYSVIEQIPKAGKFVKENRKIYLTLNPSDYRKIKVPNVLGKTGRQAQPTLLAMGFKIGKVSTRPHISDHVLELRYKGSKLEPGTEIPKTSEIDLIVGDGSQNRVNEASEENIEEIEEDGGN
ncbi:PASTA domain-containing protein [Ulvibacter antarcticus]|uniref:PASTA domain-containing protein n=1 Tax=Ulvibacter antarcticus TaxID=442714 RepID=A0A3L9YCG9_9FLAO|nr:PASTA domain-containing protein [Ulvibacter antarcticus]RMA56809.1 PASTA domain-containing protein [Ulvibacter antarcticus]